QLLNGPSRIVGIPGEGVAYHLGKWIRITDERIPADIRKTRHESLAQRIPINGLEQPASKSNVATELRWLRPPRIELDREPQPVVWASHHDSPTALPPLIA